MDIAEELIKEVFARFGSAYYYSEVLHKGLCNIHAIASFENTTDITRPRIEEKFSHAYSLTLGQIAGETKGFLPNDLRQRLEQAVEKRNYLAHRFWFERSHLMYSEESLSHMRQELLDLTDLFATLDEDITDYFKPKRVAAGVTDEMIQESLDELVAGTLEEPLPSQRSLKKQERIVRVWDVKVGDNLIVQIFETEDGCLWQFCDVGLGWTPFEKPTQNWTINERLQEYLPANINPRPSITEPWNYQFRLAKGAVLWVRPGKRERSYAWGINVPSKL